MMTAKKILSLFLLFSFTSSLSFGQTTQPDRDLPVVITIGRPNIWSLEQAHYLLTRMHHRNRELEATPLQGLDANQVNATRIKLLRQLLGISADFAQVKVPVGAGDDGESAEKETAENKAALEANLPESVIKDFEKFIEDPKLNASTELSNYINLQYEIISQQLTTLRDEVGNGERLVFLELPHSVYTTPKSGDKRLAQVWWRVEGFSRLDERIGKRVAAKRKIAGIKNGLDSVFEDKQPLRNLQINLSSIDKLISDTDAVSDAFDEWQKSQPAAGTTDFNQKRDEIADKIDVVIGNFGTVIKTLTDQKNSFIKIQNDRDLTDAEREKLEKLKDLLRDFEGLKNQAKSAVSDLRNLTALNCVPPARLFEAEENPTPPLVSELIQSARQAQENFIARYKTNQEITGGLAQNCTEYVPLYAEKKVGDKERIIKLAENSDEPVRTIDLIPRQSSLIVNQTYDSVNGLNLWGGFAWLFGLGVKSNFQRQKEDFQQFLHQEVYASGFGKGEQDFGWTFGPLPGTKRLAPGLRTTYAVVIIPKDAETVHLKAKGCFFKQKFNQPYNYTATGNWSEEDDDRFCEQEQDYFIDVPNGGDYQGFSVDQIRYLAGQEPGNRMVVSVKGKNFSPQIGVTINGVPLCQSVGLAQTYLDKINLKDTICGEKDGISGQVEYIDMEEVLFSFKMPKDFKGTPTIHFIGPGRAAFLNRLPRVRVNGVLQKLADAPFMIGAKSQKPFSIKDMKIFRTGNPAILGALLIGENFKSTAQIFVNGQPATPQFTFKNQIGIIFPNQTDEKLNVTVIQDNAAATGKDTDAASFPNLPTLTIDKTEIISYEAAKNGEEAVMIVKLEGKGFTGLTGTITGADVKKSALVELSPREAVLKLISPEPLVQIALKNSLEQTARTVVIRPAGQAAKDK